MKAIYWTNLHARKKLRNQMPVGMNKPAVLAHCRLLNAPDWTYVVGPREVTVASRALVSLSSRP